MRTTVTIDDGLLTRASELTRVPDRATLLRHGLETLVRVESARRLAALGGSDAEAEAEAEAEASSAPRRRDGVA